jgi:hypothetical protein
MNDEEKKDPKDTLDLNGDDSDKQDRDGNPFDSSETVKFSDEDLSDFRKAEEITDPFDVGQRDDSTRILDSQDVKKEKEKEQTIKEMWKKYEQETQEVDASSLRGGPRPETRDDRTQVMTGPGKPPFQPPKTPSTQPSAPTPAQTRVKPPVPDYLSKHARKQRRSKRAPFILLLFFIIAAVAVAYYFYSQSQANQSEIPATAEPSQQTQQQSVATDTTTPAAAREPAPQLFPLNVDDLMGISPLNVAAKGAVFSDEMDPEIVAIAKALKSRIKIYNGEKTRKYRNTTTQTITGRFRGFSVKSVVSYKNEDKIKDQLTLVAPSKGSLIVENDVLISAKKIDYERFFRDLRRAGIQVIRKADPNQSGDFRVQLALTPLPNQTVPEAKMIAFNRAGPVQLGMRSTQLDRVVPPRYNIVRKKILVDDQYVNVHKIFNERNKALLLLSVSDNRIKTVQIIDASFKTSQGIGIGNTLADLKISHLDLTMGKTKENVVYAVIKGINAKFMLSGSGADFNKQIFPNNMKITSIVLEN